jgi:hypothetical protein
MMFHAFCILLCCFFIYAKRNQKIPDDLMAFFTAYGQLLA